MLTTIMFVMRMRWQVEAAVMIGVIVAKLKLPTRIHVVIGIGQPFNAYFDIHVFAHTEDVVAISA